MKDDVMYWRGMRIHVQSGGSGAPLLLINGLGSNTDMWAPLVSRLGRRFVASFDAPGAGRSSPPHWPVTIPELARLAVAVLNRFEIESADVLGYSYGGAVAQQLAFDFPERVRRLVLAATNCGVGAWLGSLRAMAVLSTPFRYYSSTYFKRIAEATYGGRTGRNLDIRHRMTVARKRFPPSSYGYAMQLLGGCTWSSIHFLSRIVHRTLVISGDDDPLIPVENAKLLAGSIPNSTLDLVERAGHLFLLDDADHIGDRIGCFLADEVVAADARLPVTTNGQAGNGSARYPDG